MLIVFLAVLLVLAACYLMQRGFKALLSGCHQLQMHMYSPLGNFTRAEHICMIIWITQQTADVCIGSGTKCRYGLVKIYSLGHTRSRRYREKKKENHNNKWCEPTEFLVTNEIQ